MSAASGLPLLTERERNPYWPPRTYQENLSQILKNEDAVIQGFDALLQVTPEGMPRDEDMKKETASANIADAVSGHTIANTRFLP